jgi:hypothetical protein
MNEDDLKIKNNVAEKLVNEKEQIEKEKERIEKMSKDLEERKEKINKNFFGKFLKRLIVYITLFLYMSCKICFIRLQINNKFCNDDILIKVRSKFSNHSYHLLLFFLLVIS